MAAANLLINNLLCATPASTAIRRVLISLAVIDIVALDAVEVETDNDGAEPECEDILVTAETLVATDMFVDAETLVTVVEVDTVVDSEMAEHPLADLADVLLVTVPVLTGLISAIIWASTAIGAGVGVGARL